MAKAKSKSNAPKWREVEDYSKDYILRDIPDEGIERKELAKVASKKYDLKQSTIDAKFGRLLGQKKMVSKEGKLYVK